MRAALTRSTLLFALVACGAEGKEEERFGASGAEPIAPRYGTVVVDGCTLDASQTAALDSSGAHRALKEVVMLCPSMRSNGDVAPVDTAARAALTAQIASLQQLGYAVHLGATLDDDAGKPLSADGDTLALNNPEWRAKVIRALAAFPAADGIDLHLQNVPSGVRASVRAFVAELRSALGPNAYLGIFVPPAVDRGDIASASAYDLAAISHDVSRVRLMTLDYSTGKGDGPAIDSGWAVDAARAARQSLGSVALDVAVPLFGTEFSDRGERDVGFAEAIALAESNHVRPQRGPTGALHFEWTDVQSGVHNVWFDDAVSTARTLHAWDARTLPLEVGVLFYGLGAEDPRVWDTISRGLR